MVLLVEQTMASSGYKCSLFNCYPNMELADNAPRGVPAPSMPTTPPHSVSVLAIWCLLYYYYTGYTNKGLNYCTLSLTNFNNGWQCQSGH